MIDCIHQDSWSIGTMIIQSKMTTILSSNSMIKEILGSLGKYVSFDISNGNVTIDIMRIMYQNHHVLRETDVSLKA